jgi:hypothetical protein
MPLTTAQITALDSLTDYIPALKKGQLAAGEQILLGTLLAKLEPDTVAGAALATIAAAAAGGTYTAAEQGLVNELRTRVIELVTRVNALQTAINAAAA